MVFNGIYYKSKYPLITALHAITTKNPANKSWKMDCVKDNTMIYTTEALMIVLIWVLLFSSLSIDANRAPESPAIPSIGIPTIAETIKIPINAKYGFSKNRVDIAEDAK